MGTITLEEYRAQIDIVDHILLVLLNERARLAAQVGALKAVSGMPRSDRRRERQIVEGVVRANGGPLDSTAVTSIFRCIIKESRRAQVYVNAVEKSGIT